MQMAGGDILKYNEIRRLNISEFLRIFEVYINTLERERKNGSK